MPLTLSRYILPARSRKAQQFISMMFLLTYVLAGVGPLIHHHAFSIRLTSDARVAAHTCGDFERHVSLDALRGCFTCWQSGQRESTVVKGTFAGYAGIGVTVVPEHRLQLPHSVSRLFPDKRGPPAVV
jgi:hypothetical protein